MHHQSANEKQLVNDVLVLIQKGELIEGKRRLDEMTLCYGLSSELQFARGFLSYLEKDNANAIQSLQESIKNNQSAYYTNALSLLGILYSLEKQYDNAIETHQKCLALNPKEESSLQNLAYVYERLNKLDEVANCYELLAKINPANKNYLLGKGLVFKKLYRWQEAIDAYQQLLSIDPNHADCLNKLSTVYRHLGRYEDARVLVNKSLSIRDKDLESLNNLALIYQGQNNSAEAKKVFLKILSLDNQYITALNNLGTLYQSENDISQALECFNKVLDIDKDNVYALNNLAVIKQATNNYDEAQALCEQAVRLQPNYTDGLNNLGIIYKIQKQFDKALNEFDKAIALKPDYHECKFNKSMLLLLLGQLKEGFALYESRKHLETFKPTKKLIDNFVAMLPWDGQSSLENKKIVIVAEQGYGDFIQFVRFTALMKMQKAQVYLYCSERLQELLLTCESVDGLYDEQKAYHYFVPVMSLPHYLQWNYRNSQFRFPYLAANKERICHFSSKIQSGKLKIGLVWSGSVNNINDRNRSIPIDYFERLFKKTDIQLYSLQVGERSEDYKKYSWGNSIIDLTPYIHNFADTAALIELLDLVISVDTAVAHLTGALNKPGLVLLPEVPDWRWLLNSDKTLWYDTLTLIRQKNRGDWGSVIDAVIQSVDIKQEVR